MPYVSPLGWIVKRDPQKARETILDRLRTHEGNVSHTAASFDMSHRAFCKVVASLGLKRDIASLRKQIGINWEREAPIRARDLKKSG